MIEKLYFDNGEEINMEVWERMLCKMNHALSLCRGSAMQWGKYGDWNDMMSYLCDFIEELQIWNVMLEKRDYYVLTMDPVYGQPTGNVKTIEMTPYEAYEYAQKHAYIYDDYAQAMARAMD